jgi:3-isopropylmalate/(R)-2-methylmalate dehydratase large subunit
LESFGVIYERNAINAAFPIVTCSNPEELDIITGDTIKIDFKTGEIANKRNHKTLMAEPFSDVQYNIYQKGGLLGK